VLTETHTCDTLSRYSAKRNLHHADFICHAPEAKQVSIIGDFNDWNPNATPVIRQPDGQWTASLELSHGYHDYVFLVDGKRVLDPSASGKTKDPHNEPVSLVAICTLYGLARHDQPARNPEKRSLPEIPARRQKGKKT
jgi:1,4-alpha-glucan branching enzyme